MRGKCESKRIAPNMRPAEIARWADALFGVASGRIFWVRVRGVEVGLRSGGNLFERFGICF